MLYDDYLRTVAERFDQLIENIATQHNFEYGNEYEVALCQLLREVLPWKFGVCRGYAVAADGGKAGDDIIVYDRERFPTLRLLPQDDFSRKQCIPVEALCAYIEAKHCLHVEGRGGQSLLKAFSQVRAVKMLARNPVPLDAPDPYMAPLQEFLDRWRSDAGTWPPAEGRGVIQLEVDLMPGWPSVRNPIFGAIIAHNARLKKSGDVVKDTDVLRQALMDTPLRERPWPDAVIVGKDLLFLPVLNREGIRAYYSPFFVEPISELEVWQREGLAFAVGMCSLLFALDYIRLGKMPWMEILADGLGIKLATGDTGAEK